MGIILLYYQHTLKNGSPSFWDNEIYTSDMTGDITYDITYDIPYEIYILFGIIRTMY
mgnify:CR=1 FL=1